MGNSLEAGRKEPKGATRKLSLQAKGMFIDASISSPASAIGQAARIAQRCMDLRMNPVALGGSLLSQDDLVEDIRNLGNSHHLKTGANRKKPLNIDEVENVITRDFSMAEALMRLPVERLQEIYSATNGKPTTEDEEEELVEKALRWLEAIGIDLEYQAPNPDESFR